MTAEIQPQYGVIKAKTDLLVTDLLVVPHRGGDLTVRYPAFGRDSYLGNIRSMQNEFYHSDELQRVAFRPATTSESVSAVAYKFRELTKPEILDPSWLQLGLIVRTSEGVFANPPKNAEGNPITDEAELKAYLDSCRRVNGIYLGDNDFGFAPYETFERGVQESRTFAEGGLARLLEHSDEKIAYKLGEISSSENYPRGVNVYGFKETSEPHLIVSALSSCGGFDLGLDVFGFRGYGRGGYAFEVQKTGEASRAEN